MVLIWFYGKVIQVRVSAYVFDSKQSVSLSIMDLVWLFSHVQNKYFIHSFPSKRHLKNRQFALSQCKMWTKIFKIYTVSMKQYCPMLSSAFYPSWSSEATLILPLAMILFHLIIFHILQTHVFRTALFCCIRKAKPSCSSKGVLAEYPWADECIR